MQAEGLGSGRTDGLLIVARDDAVALVHIGTQHTARFRALLGHQLFARLGFTRAIVPANSQPKGSGKAHAGLTIQVAGTLSEALALAQLNVRS